jgi:hypothetical protein
VVSVPEVNHNYEREHRLNPGSSAAAPTTARSAVLTHRARDRHRRAALPPSSTTSISVSGWTTPARASCTSRARRSGRRWTRPADASPLRWKTAWSS